MTDLTLLLLGLLTVAGCFVTACLLAKVPILSMSSEAPARLGAIDGLRGYLALMVFLHHSTVMYAWKRTGTWDFPPFALYGSMGRAGVYVFFMITGFLFIHRLLQSNASHHWGRLYLSRFFRIVPLYLVVVLALLLLSLNASGFRLAESPVDLLKDLGNWALFFGQSINHFHDTNLAIASVDWSLRYEWAFYLTLPLLLLLLTRFRTVLIWIAVLFLVCGLTPRPWRPTGTSYQYLFAIGGLAAAIVCHRPRWTQLLKGPQYSSLSLLALFVALACPAQHAEGVQGLSLAVFFIPIACGNTLFGILRANGSILLGEISYSIYLLHGLLLYCLFTLGMPSLACSLSPEAFGLLMIPTGLLLVVMTHLSYKLIEAPGIRFGRRLAARLWEKQGSIP